MTSLTEIKNKITYRPQERMATLRSLSLGEQSTLLLDVSAYVQQDIIANLSDVELVNLLDHMDLRAAESVLERMKDEKRRTKIVKRLKSDIREKVEFFLRFHPKATLSLVHFNYIYVGGDVTVGEVGEMIEEHHQETGKFPEVLIHHQGALQGEVPLGVLVRASNAAKLAAYVKPVQTITYRAEVSEIIDTLTASGRKKVVVLDNDESVLGIIYANDAIELFGSLPAKSLYSFTGVDSSERPLDSALSKFYRRYRWLILNLFTAFFAGSVILMFQNTIDQLAIMAVFIPIVAGMGGNAASQAFAVMLRGLTLGAVTFKDAASIVSREATAGLLNGLVIGGIVAVISIAVYGDAWLGLVVGVTMIAQHIIAASAGSFIPLYLKHHGLDPATLSTMLMTTVTDVLGIAILLGLGTVLLL